MSNLETEVNELREQVAKLIMKVSTVPAVMEGYQVQLNHLRQEIDDLRSVMPRSQAGVPYKIDLPDIDKVTQIKAQLFVNKPRQGVPAKKLKVSIWTCPVDEIKQYTDGTMAAFYFPLTTPDKIKVKRPASPLAQAVEQATTADLIGCRVRKGGREGTVIHENQVAVVHDEQLTLHTDAWTDLVFDKATRPRRNGDDNAPVLLWVWWPE